jgi:hypothetical protein
LLSKAFCIANKSGSSAACPNVKFNLFLIVAASNCLLILSATAFASSAFLKAPSKSAGSTFPDFASFLPKFIIFGTDTPTPVAVPEINPSGADSVNLCIPFASKLIP